MYLLFSTFVLIAHLSIKTAAQHAVTAVKSSRPVLAQPSALGSTISSSCTKIIYKGKCAVNENAQQCTSHVTKTSTKTITLTPTSIRGKFGTLEKPTNVSHQVTGSSTGHLTISKPLVAKFSTSIGKSGNAPNVQRSSGQPAPTAKGENFEGSKDLATTANSASGVGEGQNGKIGGNGVAKGTLGTSTSANGTFKAQNNTKPQMQGVRDEPSASGLNGTNGQEGNEDLSRNLSDIGQSMDGVSAQQVSGSSLHDRRDGESGDDAHDTPSTKGQYARAHQSGNGLYGLENQRRALRRGMSGDTYQRAAVGFAAQKCVTQTLTCCSASVATRSSKLLQSKPTKVVVVTETTIATITAHKV